MNNETDTSAVTVRARLVDKPTVCVWYQPTAQQLFEDEKMPRGDSLFVSQRPSPRLNTVIGRVAETKAK